MVEISEIYGDFWLFMFVLDGTSYRRGRGRLRFLHASAGGSAKRSSTSVVGSLARTLPRTRRRYRPPVLTATEHACIITASTSGGDQPILVYRSDYRPTLFPKPSGRHAPLPVKTLWGVFDTPLNKAWPAVGLQICAVLKAWKLRRWSIDPARFFTDRRCGGNAQGALGPPVVVWIGVADNMGDTSDDWDVFVAHEAKVKPAFEDSVVDLGCVPFLVFLSLTTLPLFRFPAHSSRSLFCVLPFRFPDERKLRIVACATEDDFAHPAEFDAEGQRCLMVGKDGSTMGLTVGRYAGVMSFIGHEVDIVSRELGIYNAGLDVADSSSKKGDPGSLIWHPRTGAACMVGQLHSGRNKGQTTGNHIIYATPVWYLLE
ncbi:hypothetical protein BD413DRAFT_614815 [Trametes elegans]|nr:hypothetical protein BD413DRAFT_614815 [Trametes elegans]